MKKQNKKNIKMSRNIYGQRCISKVVVLKKETAIDQYVEILNDIEQHKRMNINVVVLVFPTRECSINTCFTF